MKLSYAVLLDGGFIKHKLSTPRLQIDAAGIGSLASAISGLPCLADMRLHRIYYYDSKPLEGTETKPLGGGQIHFGSSPTAVRNKTLHAALTTQPFFALRFGELHLHGWRLRPGVLRGPGPQIQVRTNDLEPNIRQKGVDMRIGLDIASLTLKKHVQVIVLVTGDSDFVPAMKFARREGAQLVLITLGHGVKDALKEHADIVVDSYPF